MCQRLLLKGRSGSGCRKLRVPDGVGQPGPADGPRHRHRPRFPALSLATPQRPREAERLCYASALVTRLCSAVTTPSSEGGPKRMSFGRPFKAVPAWASGLGEVSELRWGAQLWTVQLSSCGSLACCLGCWF